MPTKKKDQPKEEKETKPEYDPQAVFEAAIEDNSQVALVPRKHDHYFPRFSEWDYKGKKYQVYMLLNAGDSVKVGFNPVN